MRYFFPILTVFTMLITVVSLAHAETIMNDNSGKIIPFSSAFQNMTSHSSSSADNDTQREVDGTVNTAFWPFSHGESGESSSMKPKSTRKAFFLSFLLPGLGETYVGSKRSFLFYGIEAVAWWLYLTNTSEGNDIEDDFHSFADTHWNYYDYEKSYDEQDRNYFAWLQYHFREVNLPEVTNPKDTATINNQIEEATKKTNSSIEGHSVHYLPSKKTQQYYEMIGKYPQFVYGWEDIYDTTLNQTIIQENGSIKYDEALQNINSPLRMKYETMRNDSNKKLKAGQRGIYIMLINRVFSAIDAARLAYHHNQKLDSELSMIRFQYVEKYIIDNNVPILMLTKKF